MVLSLLRRFPAVGIVGARQVGKTTLARQIAASYGRDVSFFDLEDPRDMARLEDPMLALQPLKGLVVIDEVQRYPGIFQVLRVLADRPRNRTRFLILGSASPDLLRQSTETLAGRIIYHELGGFSIEDIGTRNIDRLWLRGGFPRSYLARSLAASEEWRLGFIRTFLERDIPQLGFSLNPATLRRFWMMIAHYHGQTWNASELARAFGLSDTTIKRYLDILTASMVVRQLQPWHANISKRQVRAPKVYVSDSGILHSLLGLTTMHDLTGHPKVGASWEGFVLDQIIRRLNVPWERCYFWATHAGAEIDLVVIYGARRLGFEIKRTTAPKMTLSMVNALKDLQLQRIDVVHAGEETFPLQKNIRAVSFPGLLKDIKPLR